MEEKVESWISTRTSRIVFVCRVGKRPRQDIKSQAPSKAVANTDVEELAASSIWKKENRRLGKQRTQLFITICASDLAWLFQRNDKVISKGSSFLFSNSLSLFRGFPNCRHAFSDLHFYGPSVRLFRQLIRHLPLRSFLLRCFSQNQQLGKNNSSQEQKRRRWKLYRNKKFFSDPQAIHALLLPPIS